VTTVIHYSASKTKSRQFGLVTSLCTHLNAVRQRNCK